MHLRRGRARRAAGRGVRGRGEGRVASHTLGGRSRQSAAVVAARARARSDVFAREGPAAPVGGRELDVALDAAEAGVVEDLILGAHALGRVHGLVAARTLLAAAAEPAERRRAHDLGAGARRRRGGGRSRDGSAHRRRSRIRCGGGHVCRRSSLAVGGGRSERPLRRRGRLAVAAVASARRGRR